MALALEGIRVLDFTDSIAGPTTTLLLAYCGAEVIRIESHLHLGFRRNGPWGPRGNGGIPLIPEELVDFSQVDDQLLIGPTYAEVHHDKKSITLNLAKPEGRELFKKLVKISDVIVENFSFGVMQKWGFDYANLQKLKEDIIVASIPSLGKGPHERWTTWGMNLLSMSGFSYFWGHPDTPATERMASGFHGDYIAGTKAAAAILGAIFYRARTGKGQFIEISQAESTVSVLGPAYLDYFVNGHISPPMGNRHPECAPYNSYRCSGNDNWCVIAVFNESQWQNLCKVMDYPQWTGDPKFKDLASRLKNVEELDRNIEKWTSQRTPHQVMKLLQELEIPAGAVQNNEEVYFDLQLRERGFVIQQDLPPRDGTISISGAPLRLTEGQIKPSRHTPLLGEHNDYVFRELLQMDPEEIKKLEAQKVIF